MRFCLFRGKCVCDDCYNAWIQWYIDGTEVSYNYMLYLQDELDILTYGGSPAMNGQPSSQQDADYRKRIIAQRGPLVQAEAQNVGKACNKTCPGWVPVVPLRGISLSKPKNIPQILIPPGMPP